MNAIAPAAELVAVNGLRKSFSAPDGGALPVLDGIELEVRGGEIVALLGKSGSGKSTLLRCIAGLVQPTAGTVTFRGAPLRGTNPGTSLVFQSFALLPWLTVQENVELGLEAQGVGRQERAERAVRAIDLIGLDGFESAYPKELSGGMRQRVGFARALVVEPDLLLMDEPFSALDVLTAENLRTELLELWQAGEFPTHAILMVTHNIEEAVMFADRVIVLGSKPGRIETEVTVDLPRPRDRRTPAFEALVDRVYGVMTQRTERAAEPLAAVGAAGTAGPGGAAGTLGLGGPADTPGPGGAAGTPAPGGPAGPAHGPARGPEAPRIEPLPRATVDGLSGLLEIVLAAGGVEDLADLASDLMLEVDDLLPLVDAATLLGFATVEHGAVRLTDAGELFAGADIQASKDLFQQAALARVPLVRTIRLALTRSVDGGLQRGFFVDLLRQRLGDEGARDQLDIAIDWGRYAELFEYDATRGELTLHRDHGAVVAPS